jgi:tetratricopeptide (TPR) repeat protein
MKKTFKPVVLLCLPLALLTACGSPAPPRPPAAVENAISADKEARRALRDGDLPVARNLFEQSLRLQQSLDNLPGVASAAISLAAVYHRMNDDAKALALLDGILKDQLVPYPAELRAMASFRKAVILVDGNSKEAAAAVEAAAQLCVKSCEFVAGLNNLRARLALGSKDYATAAIFAMAAADAAGDNKEELANARRHAAAARAALGQTGPALEHYLAALELDKQLGLPRRIAEDLDGVAKMLDKLGRKDEAASYARRAAAAQAVISPGAGGAKLQ